MALNILIIGAGVCGPAAALLLLRSNPDHRITVIERFPKLRANGQQIDLRAQGIPIMRKLGLLDAVKAQVVAERGVELLDQRGRRAALLAANDSGQGSQSLTSEYEIMRGDLVDILHAASLRELAKARGSGDIRYEFGKTVTEIVQDDAGVDVTFSDGAKARYDLVIGADGQYSRTRRQVFGQAASDAAFHFLGLYSAYYNIPPVAGDGPYARCVHAPGGRAVVTRPSKPDLTGAYLMAMANQEGGGADAAENTKAIQASLRQPIAAQKAVWKRLFADVEWQNERMLNGLEETDDFYAFEIAQVKMDRFVAGRVALLGDAGYVPSAVTGMGTTLSLAGAYVLAGELGRHPGDVPAALRSYETILRPMVDEAQKLSPGFPGLMFPKTALGISVLHWVVWLVTTLRIDRLLTRLMPENKGGWTPPEYPELYHSSQ